MTPRILASSLLVSVVAASGSAQAGGMECSTRQMACNAACGGDIQCVSACFQEAMRCIYDEPSPGYSAPSVDDFQEEQLRDWGTWRSAGGLIQVCIRDHECEDGDILRVGVDGRGSQEELTNDASCRDYRLSPGRHTISVYAVNGTGYKGNCGHRDANTGEITVTSYSQTGGRATPHKAATQSWKLRGGAGSSSRIDILVN